MNPILLESIRVRNGIPENLIWHQRRVDSSIGEGKLDVTLILNAMSKGLAPIEKARFVYDGDGHILEQSISPYVPARPKTIEVIECPEIDYKRKYADRHALLKAKENCPSADEIIITINGYLTDTTYSNIAFWDGCDWITPSHYLLAGTKRAALLAHGNLLERVLTSNDLKSFSLCSLINAMLDPGDVTIPIENIRI